MKYIQGDEWKYSELFKRRKILVHLCPPVHRCPPESEVDKNNPLQNLDRDVRTRFCIRQSVMMIRQIVAASSRYRLELVIRQTVAEMAAGSGQRIEELVIRVVHLVNSEHLFETAFIEGTVVRHKRQALDHRGYLLPHVRKHRSIFRILLRQPVDLLAEPLVILGLRMDEGVEGINDFSTPYYYHANATDTATLLVGCFEIYCCKISHIVHALL